MNEGTCRRSHPGTVRSPAVVVLIVLVIASSLQSLVDAVRRVGARQVVMADGVAYSDYLSTPAHRFPAWARVTTGTWPVWRPVAAVLTYHSERRYCQ